MNYVHAHNVYHHGLAVLVSDFHTGKTIGRAVWVDIPGNWKLYWGGGSDDVSEYLPRLFDKAAVGRVASHISEKGG